MLDFLPNINCIPPRQVIEQLRDHANQPTEQILMDEKLLESAVYQRPYQYLLKFSQKKQLDYFEYKQPIRNALNCLETLLEYCCIKDPTWSELSRFSKFLNTQLNDCENSIFCKVEVTGHDFYLTDFKKFVVRFMLRMAQDFATPSLALNDPSPDNTKADLLKVHQLRRRWESGFHPYLFFNADRMSISFVQFNINAQGDFCDPKTNKIVEDKIMSKALLRDLKKCQVPVNQDFDALNRMEKLQTLCNVFGVGKVHDPDPSYELTTDNVLKMLAIHMRFRCNIPVIVMGETGCGKTRMVEFMSKLKAGDHKDVKNMEVVKVHGGITVSAIQEKVIKAVQLATDNLKNKNLETVLFLDEANTTEAIFAIKEIVCDATVHGRPFADSGLKIVAACNPYRKHDDDVIEFMESTGLGFHVKAKDVTETFASIPMRHLVYRVIQLPPSMQPLVWDFGQLTNHVEAIYIRQMVLKLQKDIKNDNSVENLSDKVVDVITNCLSFSQIYMREERETCSFVSLRDVERAIKSFKWFYKNWNLLANLLNGNNISRPLKVLIQALGVCYHVTLDERKPYREMIAKELQKVTNVEEGDILNEIVTCQNVFLGQIELEKNIGRNEALRENVFMMIVCTEMRIPLFLVGKPGSSKSLAKTIVTNAMQGRNSKSELFRSLKQIHVASFQCSAVSDAVGIERVFTQCARLQKSQNLDEFVAVVVLDEIGLAEDSPKMPLKVLHPLLENACTNSQFADEPFSKVGFVGISNWALDPAKMNRGIFVTRGKPSHDDLEKTAVAIFESDKNKFQNAASVIKALTSAYLKVCESQIKQRKKEFFGLRDYYGLLKMLFAVSDKKDVLYFGDIGNLVLRNFSGSERNVSHIFFEHLESCFSYVYQIPLNVPNLIQENLHSEFESRYLLLLTNQYSAVSLLPTVMEKIKDYQVIFGSSFPNDHDYTEVCRNINRIKVCMETGRTVVLLNLRDLYESLYDALNQHYVTFADQRYVDLGLGGHRVKCRVAKNFRLIVIEEKEVVYDHYPIPLINRLEKHVFDMTSIFTANENERLHHLHEWVLKFSSCNQKSTKWNFLKEETFPGYKDDTPASALLSTPNRDLKSAKLSILQTASFDGVCRLSMSHLADEAEHLQNVYLNEQQHDTLLSVLESQFHRQQKMCVCEITSFSQILNDRDRQEMENYLSLGKNSIMLLTLQQFQTEREFSERLDKFFDSVTLHPDSSYALFIQCPHAHLHGNLIACAKYATMNKVKALLEGGRYSKVVVLFLFTMERHITATKATASFTSFHSENCSSFYVDELKPAKRLIAPITKLWDKAVPDVLEAAVKGPGYEVLSVEKLMTDCIPEAMTKLQNIDGRLKRNRARILNEICLKSLFSSNFRKILLDYVVVLLKDREAILNSDKSWIVTVACSGQTLQESGSLNRALWLHIRKLVSVAIANVVHIADADNNLDLLQDRSLVNLWLQMFESKNFFGPSWPDGRLAKSFVVKSLMKQSCSFPFFYIVFKHLWKALTAIKELHQDLNQQQIFDSLQRTPAQSFLNEALQMRNAQELIKRFIHDLVSYLYKSESSDASHQYEAEVEVVEECMFNWFQAQRKLQKNFNSFLEVFVLFIDVQDRLELFSIAVGVSYDVLKDKNQWIDQQAKSKDFVAHKLAFVSLVTKLHDEARKSIGAVDTCENWTTLVRKAKSVAHVVVPTLEDKYQQMWTQIVFVEIFLDQLIPSTSNEPRGNYLSVLSPYARRLYVASAKRKHLSELLNVVTKIMQGCLIDIELHLLCSWKGMKCKACKSDRISEPVILPCDHFVCLKCTASQIPDKKCPICQCAISSDTVIEPVKLTAKHREELNTFKLACNSFFLEYLSTFCFPVSHSSSTQPPLKPSNETLKSVLQQLVICDKTTHDASSLSNFGLHVAARAYILQLLLHYDTTFVEEQLNKSLKTFERLVSNDKAICFEIYAQCVQNLMLANAENSIDEEDDEILNLKLARKLLADCEKKKTNHQSQLQHIEFCVQLQHVVQITVSSIYKLHSQQLSSRKSERLMRELVSEVNKVCQNVKFSILQQSIVKEFCKQYGLSAFDILLEDDAFRPFVPLELLEACSNKENDLYFVSDGFVLSGSSYINIKALLLRVNSQSDLATVFQNLVHEIQQTPDSVFQVLLALSVWKSKGDADKKLRRKTFDHLMGRLQTHFSGKPYQQMFTDIAAGEFDCFKLDNEPMLMQYKMVELLSMFAVTVFWNNQGLLSKFAELIVHPDQCAKAFLPTMPESNYFQVKKVMEQEIAYGVSPKAFLCPKGHLYFIGECTRANQSGFCPECRQPIGGQAYNVLHEGNRPGEITEASQAGYKLKSASSCSSSTPERSLSKTSVCVVRFCLHATMLLSSRNGNNVKR